MSPLQVASAVLKGGQSEFRGKCSSPRLTSELLERQREEAAIAGVHEESSGEDITPNEHDKRLSEHRLSSEVHAHQRIETSADVERRKPQTSRE